MLCLSSKSSASRPQWFVAAGFILWQMRRCKKARKGYAQSFCLMSSTGCQVTSHFGSGLWHSKLLRSSIMMSSSLRACNLRMSSAQQERVSVPPAITSFRPRIVRDKRTLPLSSTKRSSGWQCQVLWREKLAHRFAQPRWSERLAGQPLISDGGLTAQWPLARLQPSCQKLLQLAHNLANSTEWPKNMRGFGGTRAQWR
jgi:hypothetical protein